MLGKIGVMLGCAGIGLFLVFLDLKITRGAVGLKLNDYFNEGWPLHRDG